MMDSKAFGTCCHLCFWNTLVEEVSHLHFPKVLLPCAPRDKDKRKLMAETSAESVRQQCWMERSMEIPPNVFHRDNLIHSLCSGREEVQGRWMRFFLCRSFPWQRSLPSKNSVAPCTRSGLADTFCNQWWCQLFVAASATANQLWY